MSEDNDKEAFESQFATLQLSDSTLQISTTATIVPSETRSSHTEALPLIRTTASGDTHPELSLKGTLGEGGMGVVHLARQVPLSRDVAVKRPRAANDARAADRVLHEALITGALEHPNVVPIHVLGRDENEMPLIVMKRVEGVSWLEVIEDPGTAPTPDDIELEWHLNVLIQVCNAVRFAHSRGVIHRDIKPENVMLGGFGEVYLVDWGIAITTERDQDARITHRDDAHGVAGTPAYMAPEMTRDDAADVDERTDVYLLGATLHEVLAGVPPHTGSSLFEVMLSAYKSKPASYGPEVPEELQQIANRAMAVSRERRFQTVEDFREALLQYLEHRAVVQLVAEAEERLEQASALVGSDEQADLVKLANLFAETRFGFQQALRQWAKYRRAVDGLRAVRVLQFRHFVARGDADSAEAILLEIDDPGTLTGELDALREENARRREEVERLRRMQREEDLAVGWKTRIGLGLAIAGFWGGSAWVKAYARWGIPPDELEPSYLESLLFTVGVPIVAVVVFRKLIAANRFNRRLVYLLLGTLFSIAMMRIVAHILDVPLVTTTAFEFVLYGFAALALGVMTDVRVALSAFAIFAAAIGAAYLPGYQMLLIALAVLVFAIHQGYMWRPGLFVDQAETDEP